MATIHVDVVSAEEHIFSGEAEFVALPGESGELGIYPLHTPLITRIRPVLASHVARPIVLTQGLEFIQRVYGPPGKYFYAAAGANYFNIEDDARTDLTVDEIFAELPAQLEIGRQQQIAFTAVCRRYKLKNLAYEGGPHLFGEASVDAKIAANRDPRMKDMLLQNYRNWFSAGGALNVYYNLASPWSKFGSWGLTDVLEQDTPKHAAIAEVLANPRPSPSASSVTPRGRAGSK